MGDPAVLENKEKLRKLMKEHSNLARLVKSYEEYRKLSKEFSENEAMLAKGIEDEDFRELVQQEVQEQTAQVQKLEQEIQILLMPASENDRRNIIAEIRAGTGGEEAALFAGDLFRMYSRYAESQKWKIEIIETRPGSMGGFKEIIFSIEGENVHRKMRYESGVHRVQRIPVTESGGRIHTSAVSVAVLPEPEPVEVTIDPKDLRIDVFRSSGPGGQSVNTMDSAVRITHAPTGIIVQCQDEKSQRRNKEKAMRHLRAKLMEIEEQKKASQRAADRKSQIGTGDRSEKIRTYNFPQNRITDHRIGFTARNLDMVLNGTLDEVIESLMAEDFKKRLQKKKFSRN